MNQWRKQTLLSITPPTVFILSRSLEEWAKSIKHYRKDSIWPVRHFWLWAFVCESKINYGFDDQTVAPLDCVCVMTAVLCSRLRERTHSLWAFLMSERQNYLNPFYSPVYSEAHPVLVPSTLPYNFKSVQLSSPPCCCIFMVFRLNPKGILMSVKQSISDVSFHWNLIHAFVCTCVSQVLEEHVPPVWSVHAPTSVDSQNHPYSEREQPQGREHAASTGEREWTQTLILSIEPPCC